MVSVLGDRPRISAFVDNPVQRDVAENPGENGTLLEIVIALLRVVVRGPRAVRRRFDVHIVHVDGVVDAADVDPVTLAFLDGLPPESAEPLGFRVIGVRPFVHRVATTALNE
ncbi:hypothetical protein [Natronorubrum sp. FCH18a]|uniref:hypothetical protein n=1 Tax=Natronorubrum sp. FCH18a TaxID=3447018 RepID=UPI003F514BF5